MKGFYSLCLVETFCIYTLNLDNTPLTRKHTPTDVKYNNGNIHRNRMKVHSLQNVKLFVSFALVSAYDSAATDLTLIDIKLNYICVFLARRY